MHTLPLKEIIVEDRQRQDYGDIDDLAESIRENGLIQPLVVNQKKRLIAGGRRLAACTKLGLTEVPVVFRETMSERQLAILELEENIRRKDLNWKERVQNVYKVHMLAHEEKALEGEHWTARHTGEMLGMSRANADFMIMVAKELRDPNSKVHACDGLWDAIRTIMGRNIDEAQAEIARRTQALMRSNQAAAGLPTVTGSGPLVVEPVENIGNPGVSMNTIPLSKQILLGNCLKILDELPPACVDHCITDPPYAIDMDMLEQQNPHGGMQNIDRIRETHQVDENLVLLANVIPKIWRVMKDKGFFIMFCDAMNWQFVYDCATNIGFKVQRWPLIWHKTSQCMNQCAQYNFTKNFEIAMVCRKQGSTLVSDQQTSIFACQREEYVSNPFAKPEALWDWLVKAVSIQGQCILDPFAGEGSSVNSIISLWRYPLAIEVDPKHYNFMLDKAKRKYDLMYRNPIYV